MTVDHLVKTLDLVPHPEGGFYRETYRSEGTFTPPEIGDQRNYATTIYFLLTAGNFSAFHRISQDEGWHFYMGQAVEIHEITPEGEHVVHLLGLDFNAGQRPQLVIPAKSWFGSRVKEGGAFALVGCTVSPGFDFADFELAKRETLLERFPSHQHIINELTRS